MQNFIAMYINHLYIAINKSRGLMTDPCRTPRRKRRVRHIVYGHSEV